MDSPVKLLVKEYIAQYRALMAKEEELNDLLVSIDPFNGPISLYNPRLESLVNSLLTHIMGEDKLDWLHWWLYEINEKPSIVFIGDVETPINNFEDLWEKIIQL